MKADILIRNGRLLDPAAGIDRIGDIAVANGRILPPETRPDRVRDTVDAAGCLVVPGLIDTHVHVFDSGGELGVAADRALLPMGVTSAVDFGSAGYANFGDYMRCCVQRDTVRVRSFLNVSATGPISMRTAENIDPRGYDEGAAAAWMERYPGQILGLKVRMGRETAGELGIAPLRETVRMAQRLGCRAAVHVSNAPVPVREMAELLRPGDVFCHVYQDRGDSILDEHGRVWPEILAARERGVLFVVAHGMRNASNDVACRALEQGFRPDLIGTDLSSFVAYRSGVIGQPFLMSKFMALGLSLSEVVALCTAAPARLLGLGDDIGTLRPGAVGDLAVLRLTERPVAFRDYHGDEVRGNTLLVPELTVSAGRIVYRQVGFDTQPYTV